MAHPILVRAYTGRRPLMSNLDARRGQVLPPISAYAFADILRSIDSPDLQSAIDGIAEICAKNRMSLAEEYASHLPPVGEITMASSASAKPHQLRPGMGRALTSVPEASSSGSEGSRKSRKRGIFGFGTRKSDNLEPIRVIRIGSMGRKLSVSGTTAIANMETSKFLSMDGADSSNPTELRTSNKGKAHQRAVSAAATSLQRLLGQHNVVQPG